MSEAESRYHINKLELLSVVTCLEKNKFLLYPKEFILRVDNKSLCYMKNLSPPGRLVERLLYILSNYSFTIEHKRSGEKVHVDYLTRDGCTGTPLAEELQMAKDTKISQFLRSSFSKETLTPFHGKKNKKKMMNLNSETMDG